MKTLEGRCAIVTGGAGGIGRYLCEGLAREGATVIVADIADCASALAMIAAAGGRGVAVDCDLSDIASIRSLAARAEAEFGGCDILTHCAARQPHLPFADVAFEDWRMTMTVNLDSLFHLTQALLPGMKAKGWGRVITLTSTTFYDATVHHSEYVTSKAALIGMSRILAKEYGAFGITVNCLAPGLVRTSNSEEAVRIMLEAGFPDFFAEQRKQQCIPRTLEPTDIVGPLLFLASDASAAVTGQSLLVDGGWKHV